MKCPKCKKRIEQVYVISECEQVADIDENGKITGYGSVEEISSTIKILCPKCQKTITRYIEEI